MARFDFSLVARDVAREKQLEACSAADARATCTLQCTRNVGSDHGAWQAEHWQDIVDIQNATLHDSGPGTRKITTGSVHVLVHRDAKACIMWVRVQITSQPQTRCGRMGSCARARVASFHWISSHRDCSRAWSGDSDCGGGSWTQSALPNSPRLLD